jgi:multicomponent Na+:H+ antiporter subunit F
MMFQVAALGVLLTMLLALVRAIRGPSVYDRILAVNMFATKTMLLIAVAGFLTERPEWLDLALLYGLISFVAVLAVLRFSKYGDLGSDDQVRP